MIEVIDTVLGILVTIALLVIPFIGDRCPCCGGKLVDNDYDENIDKAVWICKRCGKKWVIL